MPDKYHIKSSPTASQFHRIGKYGSVDCRDDCSRCTNCVKPRCLYDTYKKETAHNKNPDAGVELLNECRACLSCVQGCTCLLYTSPSPRDGLLSRMPSS